ncbi:MAG: Fe(3+)-hydroxamate ABC transporter permease FhuB [Psychrobacter sp.]|uniref:Ferrichrome transport system permease protein FhuB n=1 Tax=Psychrobacter alimentarius TaxID=261164 RepID=A0ABM5ZYJ8_9GAMM|nr:MULTISPECIES: Fe(3+)-hydroxamate ABC transporter permease FhuB [Psychrobacter]AMT97168.1 Ferrichrome transport system permease protein FhuB [Psychrobacter alimentarius]MBO6225077.1 Fe(3+)-hydroxamate ABC transporter permease FhuB [Psychrobacter sp.]QCB30502.1 Fe(3+)-hydroxamate ABC transporter permease FhuB [Psychrobacter sp. PAMC27889]
MIKNTFSSANRIYLMVVFLIVMAVVSSYAVVHQLWNLPFIELFTPSFDLSLADMSIQLQILPTMLVASTAGGLLGLVSVLLQQLVKNTLASDTTLAVGSGANIALLLVTLFFPSFNLGGSFWVAFIGAISSMAIVFILAAPSRMNPLVLVLGGLVTNILLGAIAALLLIYYAEESLNIMVWAAGSLTQNNWQVSVALTIASVVAFISLMPLLKPLEIMSLDDRQAKSLGVPVNLIRGLVIGLVAILTALVVSRVGPIGFIGLGAATLVNVFSVRHIGYRLLLGYGFGALLLWITSNVTTILQHYLSLNIPADAMTALLGAPLVIWLIMMQSRQHTEELAPTLVSERRETHLLAWSIALVLLIGSILVFTATANGWQLNAVWDLIVDFRLPRTLSAAATGVMLATAGVLLQTLTRNPMASPEVLGISSGSAIGVVLAFIFLPSFGYTGIVLSGLLGASIVLCLILWLARRVNAAYLLLVGVAIAALMGGVLSLVKISGDQRLQAVLSWLSGSTYLASPETAWLLVAFAAALFLLSFMIVRPLEILSLGSGIARELGVSLRLFQSLILILVAALSTISTLAVGPLSFVGLMIPHLATTLGAVQLKRQLQLAAILGAALMVIADWLGRYIIFPYEIPAGTIAAIIGGAYFLYLMRRIRA